MDVNTDNGEYIYTGGWTDWSHGRIHGATITLSAQNAGFLTAFLALFVSISAGHLWRILSFTIHQLHASPEPKDALHHQQQVTFKNTTTPAALAWEFVLLGWAWRKNARRSIFRSIPFILIALVWLALAGATAILSAKITKSAGRDCLIMSEYCGIWTEGKDWNNSDPNTLDQFGSTQLLASNTATNYARTCYTNNSENLPQCNIYAQSRLPLHVTVNASCPFNTSICLEGPTASFTMDTGLIDTREHLGINTPDDGRVQFRKIATCSPLTRKGHVTVHNDSIPLPGYPFENYTLAAYHYGPADDGMGLQNYTYYYDIVTVRVHFAYIINANWAFAGSSQSWTPSDELNRTDADVSIFFLNANNVMYEYPTDDPMFSAHVSALEELNNGELNTSIAEKDNWYMPDSPTTVMGCTDQFQFCNPRTGFCTKLAGVAQTMDTTVVMSLITFLGFNQQQTDVFSLLINNLALNNMFYSIYGRSAYALRAQETLNDLNQMAPLPANQWQIEVQSWMETNLAKLQIRSVEFATGPRQDRANRTRIALTGDSPICKTQKVRCPAGNISFSVLGISCILVIGLIIILLNLALDPVMNYIGAMWLPASAWRRRNWALDDKLQLQRMAFEGAGSAHWSGHVAAVPVTEKGEVFGGWAESEHGTRRGMQVMAMSNTPDSENGATPLMHVMSK